MNRADTILWRLIPSLRNLRRAASPTPSTQRSIDIIAAYESELTRQRRWALWSRLGLSSALALVCAVVVAGYVFQLDWVGVSHASARPAAPFKTVWNWLQLLVIPGALAWGTVWFTHQDRKLEWQVNGYNQRQARENALDDLRESALRDYFDRMGNLLIDHNLAGSGIDADVRGVARALTLAVLERLDGKRKIQVIRFLHERHLIARGAAVVSLRGADLSDLDLSYSVLSQDDFTDIDLSGTRGKGINLAQASLPGADLHNTQFTSPILDHTMLAGADLRNGVWLLADRDACDLQGADTRNFHCVRSFGEVAISQQVAEGMAAEAGS